MPDNPQCLSFFAVGDVVDMDNAKYIRRALKLIRQRYDFHGKRGIAFSDTHESVLPGDMHNLDGGVPECDFCIWLTGFAEATAVDRDAAETKLAEISYRCGTLFFSAPGLGKPANEMALRHTRYEHAIDIGGVDGHSVFMCW